MEPPTGEEPGAAAAAAARYCSFILRSAAAEGATENKVEKRDVPNRVTHCKG